MTEESRRREIYEALHAVSQLRFPLEDYPAFYSWLNVPHGGSGLRLLDIACGQGFFLKAAEESGGELELHGVDFSQVGLEYAQARVARATLQLGSACVLPYPDEHFDYCVNLGSLEHFDQPERALREMYRVLKPTGKAMVIVPNQYYLGAIWKVLAYGEGDDQEQEGVTQFRTISGWTNLFLDDDQFDVVGVRAYNGEDHIAWYFRREAGQITQQERRWRSFLDTFVKPCIPLNLSQCFVFFLRRQPYVERRENPC